jgi:dihydrofolate reductase
MNTVDVIVMGRHSFEKVLTFDSWPYTEHKVVVLSSSNPTIPANLSDKVELFYADPPQIIERLAAKGFTHAYLDGGKTIQRFLNAGLVNELTITKIPILIGEGIPLFGSLNQDIKLQHMETRQFANGFVQSRYRMPATEQQRSDGAA